MCPRFEDRRHRAEALAVILETASREPGPDGIVPEIIARLTTHVDMVATELARRALDAALGPDPRWCALCGDRLGVNPGGGFYHCSDCGAALGHTPDTEQGGRSGQ